MKHITPDAERRRQRALQRLGTDHPVCACCPEADPLCLELHHLQGQAFGGDLVVVCRNCHRKLSDAQRDHPARIAEVPGAMERIGHFLLGLADLLKLIASKLKEFGQELIAIVAGQSA